MHRLQSVALYIVIAPVLLPASLLAAGPDTTWFGGTVWNADSARWEGAEGGTWTFDSGVGGAMEGWSGVDLTAPTLAHFRRLTTADFAGEASTCVGSPAGLGGSASLWAGVLSSETCWPGGAGYGNNWNLARAKAFHFGGGTGNVAVSFDFANDTEFGYDSTLVEVYLGTDPSAPGVLLAAYTGTASGAANLVLSAQAGTLPSPSGDFVLRFRVVSDGAYSDEDGSYDSGCGGFAVDDITLSGDVSDVSDFESGEDGWQLVTMPACGGDWTKVVPVGSLPGYPGGCDGLQGNVLAFYDDADQIHSGAMNLALSPWIDLAAAGISEPQYWVFAYDVYQHFGANERVGIELYIQYDTMPTCPRLYSAFGCLFGPLPCNYAVGCAEELRSLQLLSPGMTSAARVRFALGVSNNCDSWGDCPGNDNSSDPYFDNVRFGVVQASALGTNPPSETGFALLLTRSVVRGGAAGMELRAPAGSAVRVDLFDVAGRRVRGLYTGTAPEGSLFLDWNLRNDAGSRVPAGIYFVRATGVETAVHRLVVLP